MALAAMLPVGRAQVSPSLVAEDASVQPGRPFTVALHLVHQPHWHTYWSNPGTGLATSLTWALPPGWKAGEIQWPAPQVLRDDQKEVIGSGYDGDLFLPVTLTPSADGKAGSRVQIKATARWLMCNDICKPGQAVLSLELPVSMENPSVDPQWGPKLRAVLDNLPGADPGWNLTASKNAKSVELLVAPNRPGLPGPGTLHFFSSDGLVAFDAPQVITAEANGGSSLSLAISPDGPPDATRLIGVLTSDTGWRPDGSLPGLKVDIPFGSNRGVSAPGATGATKPVPHGGTGGDGPTHSQSSSFAGTLFLAFFGGLILNLMPCVFPVLGIKILGFVNQAGHSRGKVAAHGLVFSAGVILSFWVLAGILAVLRAGGDRLGWGFQLQSPVFIFGLAAVMLIFGLNMSGVFEFGLTATAVGGDLQSKSGLAGSFFTGVLATLVATPCSAPFLAPALGAALTLSTVQSFTIFTVIAIGLSLPYLLLSVFPQAVRVLPRPGAWMETFKQFMAFPLYATVGYLLWVLAGQVQEYGLLSAFLGLVLVAMGVWIYGRWRAPGASAGRARFGLVAGLVLIGLGAWTGWPHPPGATDIIWEKWSPETVERLRADGRIVYVDFTARWCATCQANKRLVFHSDDVLRIFRDRHIATVRGDWTNQDPRITAELAKYRRSAVPFNLVWLPGREAPVILPEVLTPGVVLRAVGE
jgi:thiol:disulfide interchange protein DsbD